MPSARVCPEIRSSSTSLARATKRERGDGEVRKGSGHTCQVGDASEEEGDAEERIRAKGHEPETGDCDRFERGAGKRREGPTEENGRSEEQPEKGQLIRP